MGAIECPQCRLVSEVGTATCECGYDFTKKTGGRKRSFLAYYGWQYLSGIGFGLALLSAILWQRSVPSYLYPMVTWVLPALPFAAFGLFCFQKRRQAYLAPGVRD